MPAMISTRIPAVAAIGMFDGVHLGHRALVAEARQMAQAKGMRTSIFTFPGHPLAVINPELAPPTLTPASEKCALLRAAGADEVCLLEFSPGLRSLTAARFMEMLMHDYGVSTLLMGFNHRFGSDGLHDFAFYHKTGADIGMDVRLSTQKVEVGGSIVSSTAIRAAIAAADMPRANDMLGRRYGISGTVAHGLQIGRTIGFPTANLQPSCHTQQIPACGAYAAIAITDKGSRHPAMVNIGHRPTISPHLPPSIEAHIIGLSEDLYGRSLTIEFCAYLRAEQQFPSLAALTAQLAQDRATTLSLINS